jgi:TonB family protein
MKAIIIFALCLFIAGCQTKRADASATLEENGSAPPTARGEDSVGISCEGGFKIPRELKITSPDYLDGPGPPPLIGERSQIEISRTIMKNREALRRAYIARLRDKPGLSGKVTVKFAIDEFGKVFYAQMVESTMPDPELEGTVVGVVKSWKFGKIDKPGDVTEVVYPFVFGDVTEAIYPFGFLE